MTDRPESSDSELPSDDAEPELPPLGDVPPAEPVATPPIESAAPEQETPQSGTEAPPPAPPQPEAPQPGTPEPGMAAPHATPPPPGPAAPGAVPPGSAGTGSAGAPPPPDMGGAAPGAGAAAAPGWYPAPGGQRYWDGQQWTEHAVAGATSPTSEYSTAMWAHLSALLISYVACGLGFIGPLIIMNGQGKQSAFVRHHAVEALNFSLTVLIAYIVSGVLIIVVIGLFLLPIVAIGSLVLYIMAAVAANRGEWYRYPVNIRFVK